MKYKIVTRGETLKKIRKTLGLKQEELSGQDITRNLISMIENEKAVLTDKAAKIIYDNLKKRIKEKNIESTVDIEELFIKEEGQVKKICNDFINEMKDNNDYSKESLYELMKLINRYNVTEEKMKIYKTIGEMYLFQGKKALGYLHLYMANEFAFACENFGEEHFHIICTMIRNAENKTDKEELLSIIDRFIKAKGQKFYVFKIIIEKARLYMDLKLYDKAYKGLQNLMLYYEDKIEYRKEKIDSDFLMAECAQELGLYNKSLECYEGILDDLKKDGFKEMLIKELGVYVHKAQLKKIFHESYYDELESIERYIEDIEKNIHIVSDEAVEMAGVLRLVGELIEEESDYYNKAICYYSESIELFEENKKIIGFSSGLERLTRMAVRKNDREGIERITKKIMDMRNNEEFSHIENSKVLTMLMEYYVKEDELAIAATIMNIG